MIQYFCRPVRVPVPHRSSGKCWEPRVWRGLRLIFHCARPTRQPLINLLGIHRLLSLANLPPPAVWINGHVVMVIATIIVFIVTAHKLTFGCYVLSKLITLFSFPTTITFSFSYNRTSALAGFTCSSTGRISDVWGSH